jgi:hypothetical protein
VVRFNEGISTVNMRVWSVLIAVAFSLAASGAWAQAPSNDPPEILTSELALKTVLESDKLDVNFVFIDQDKVAEVKINGEKQPITPGDTVLLTRSFTFTQDVTRVEVSATDEKGHTRTVVYTVFRPGVDPDKALAQEGQPSGELAWFGSYDVRSEQDSNPTNDLSSPISIKGVNVTGVVPDSRQSDSRLNLNGSVGVTKGMWNGFAGASKITYSKKENENFNVQQLYLGGGLTKPINDTLAFAFNYTFTDVNLGSHDYLQSHTLSPALRRAVDPGDGGTGVSQYGLNVVRKQFALKAFQQDTTDLSLTMDYRSIDKEKQDTYHRVFEYGTSSEGIKLSDGTDPSEYTYYGLSFGWNNRWDSGLLVDAGLGTQYRKYKSDKPLTTDTPLGATRVDIPMQVSAGLGWQFRPQLRLMGTYSYLFNLSNKSPFVRQIIGVGLNGAF